MKYDRTKLTKKQLALECSERNVGFMSSWSKPAIINRLEEEDERDLKLSSAQQQEQEYKLKPLNIWNHMHIDLNNAKAGLTYIADELAVVIEKKNELGAKYTEQERKIKELEKSLQVLADTGMFGNFETKDGMLYSDYDPDRALYKEG
jgi:hypothetical protein